MTIIYVMRCVSKAGEQVYSPLFCMEGWGSPRGERDEGGRGLEGQRGRAGVGKEVGVWKREGGC